MVPIIPYPDWILDSSPVIPAFYWDVYSSEQRWKHMCKELHKLVNYADYLRIGINLTHEMIDKLQSDIDKLNDGGWIDTYISQLIDWINANLYQLISDRIKMVFFGLTDDGYFCAYIPDSWREIQFDTGMVFGEYDYGRLILRYEVDGSGVIDNTGDYGQADFRELRKRVELLEALVRRNSTTLYTQLNHGGE